MPPYKILTVFGTRPEAIKMAPVVKELNLHPEEFTCLVAVTAQHREMLDQVLRLFHIKPDYDLDIMRPRQTLEEITTRALTGLAGVLKEARPDLVLVHGDTTTTFVAALAAFYQQIPVGHVEAGLRTGDRYAPFPEEMNRRLAGVLTDIHFAPTAKARDNLLREGIAPEHIYVTGNTVIDALKATIREEYQFGDHGLAGLDLREKRVILVTAHRRENWGEPLKEIFTALRDLIRRHPDTALIFPVHYNPRVRQLAREVLGGQERVYLIEPLDYEPFVNLMNRAYLVLTDSGGLQEEAPALGKPVLVLREVTERPEAVAAGTVRLVGTAYRDILAAAEELLTDRQAYLQMAHAVNPYGDGQASRRIRSALRHYFGMTVARPQEFQPLGATGQK
ncbi:UDP-N-acetyl glucosamine 2-epimerase [Moorella thermoacetica]|uniref:UDP-N-acetylglucosamine 2-epimerase (non-hydrolyzing) n=1 Tax=Moorella thermoacetica (strain ATCC 39073 / JCM 9320) TaxID=264732 RepID=Q2RFX0_MOOTA|nr:UDP-N-acetylglucosamine 2-epimerase (non-hydrolyzing) [Moorella thermoacetica]AKX95245.1 UDP-N-acetylglucosamine 2-epimerase [Moorella thermoacetica]AKX97870.1 UDP-N-acetylglucosamine 2-epimerase [Moorella thermoacetica]OIQ56701.1 UDP-N-acetylglucosamine 2-epimerase [Moorella thermoacetica]QDA01689.1 UDP-N-acetylglucosamine 2-epimerase [Moorella thermoacetica]TYL09296.1 UDP-N-acetylglucosamine 2-epimerase [Moorella thermoacetica]